MRLSPFLLTALLATPALAGGQPHPHLDETMPILATADAWQMQAFLIDGSDLMPTPAQTGKDQFYMNTHGAQFYKVEAQVETEDGLQGAITCATPDGDTSVCLIDSGGPSRLGVEINYLKTPGWRQGVWLHLTSSVSLPGGYSQRSNTLLVPFARGFGTPVVNGLSPSTLTSDATDWVLRIPASNIDGTVNVRFDNAAFAHAVPALSRGGNGTVIVTVPAAARGRGAHSLQLCTWHLGPRPPGTEASCSAPAAYSVVVPMMRASGAVRPVAPVQDSGTAQATVPANAPTDRPPIRIPPRLQIP